MPRKRNTELKILELIGECGVVRRQTLHLLPYHTVTINTTLRKMMESGLIVQSQTGYQKHYILTQYGKEFLCANSPSYRAHEFLPAKVQSDSWQRLLLTADVAIILEQAGYVVREHKRPALNNLNIANCTQGGFYYPATELKQFLGGNAPSLQYSRICGALITSNCAYLTYHTRDVAMELRKNGEDNVAALVRSKICRKIAYLIFGDREMLSFEKIIRNTMEPDSMENKLRGIGKDKKKSHQLTQLLNATTFGKTVHYFPIREEAVKIITIIGQHRGFESMKASMLERALLGRDYSFLRENLYKTDGEYLFYAADMDLCQIGNTLKNLSCYLKNGIVTVICLEWQKAALRRIFECYFRGYGNYRYLAMDIYRLNKE